RRRSVLLIHCRRRAAGARARALRPATHYWRTFRVADAAASQRSSASVGQVSAATASPCHAGQYVNWYGRAQEYLLLLVAEDVAKLVPILGGRRDADCTCARLLLAQAAWIPRITIRRDDGTMQRPEGKPCERQAGG